MAILYQNLWDYTPIKSKFLGFRVSRRARKVGKAGKHGNFRKEAGKAGKVYGFWQ